jgi:hypothetical protein
MIKLIDILKEIQWLTKSYDLAATYHFPLTPDVVKMLNGGERIKSFHITSFEKLNLLKSLENTKKSLSTFTRAKNKNLYKNLKAHWNSGVLCYIEGDKVIKSISDILTIPDDTGRRWIKFNAPGNTVNTSSIQRDFEEFMISKNMDILRDEILKANLEKNFSKEMNIKRNIYLKKYLKLAAEFAYIHSNKILKKLGGEDLLDDELSDTDEIVLNNIKLLDCAYSNEASPEDIQLIKKLFPGEKVPVPVGTEEAINIVNNFIKSRQ